MTVPQVAVPCTPFSYASIYILQGGTPCNSWGNRVVWPSVRRGAPVEYDWQHHQVCTVCVTVMTCMLLSNQNWADMNGVWQCKLQLSLIPRPLLACNRGCHSSEMKSRSGLGMRLCSYVKLLPVVSRREPMFFPPGLEFSHLPHLCLGIATTVYMCTCV